MTTERNNSSMTPTNGEKTTTNDTPKNEEKRDKGKRDWIDREFYTEDGGEG